MMSAANANINLDALIPAIGVITDIRQETPDVKTFSVITPGGAKAFDHMPGQCAMVGVPGIGEAMFSITSSPTNPKVHEFSIKAVGKLTNHMHNMAAGQQVTIRGPYGNSFPVEDAGGLAGKNLLFVAGGIGLAPVRSVINYVFDNRANYGDVDIVYGSRTMDDLVFRNEIENAWLRMPSTTVHLAIDRPQEGWNGHVGFVAAVLEKIKPKADKYVVVCGPPIMIKSVLAALLGMGFAKEQIYTTLELRMKCGIGKCGRCNIGNKLVCKDGPVFRCDELDHMPNEY